MREIDFLPEWYPSIRRQRAILRSQVVVSGIVVLAGIVSLLASYRRCDAAQSKLEQTNARSAQAVKEVRQLDEMLNLQGQLVAKRKIVSELGLPVELSRVISELNECMPREVSFKVVEMKTVEKPIDTIADRAKAGEKPLVTRRMELMLNGVAPTESEVTTFWSRLIQRPFFSEVRLLNSVERRSGEHCWRQFEVTFTISLDNAIE